MVEEGEEEDDKAGDGDDDDDIILAARSAGLWDGGDIVTYLHKLSHSSQCVQKDEMWTSHICWSFVRARLFSTPFILTQSPIIFSISEEEMRFFSPSHYPPRANDAGFRSIFPAQYVPSRYQASFPLLSPPSSLTSNLSSLLSPRFPLLSPLSSLPPHLSSP
eukprot:762697-Hanusia_phi.AAC.1